MRDFNILSIDRWNRELGFGLRVLRKDRGFALTAIVTLAVCLGGHAAIAAVVNALLFHPLRVTEPDRVLLMANQYPLVEDRRGVLSSTPDYADRLQHVTVFEEQALYNFLSATIETSGMPARLRGMVATPSLFRLLRVNPAHGRIFMDDEGTSGNDARVILSDGLWRELFGADPAVIGRSLRLTGREYTIVGILPREFSFVDPEVRFWIPLALTEKQRSDAARHRNGWFSIGRLRADATIEQGREQLKALDAANAERMPPRLRSLLSSTGFYTSAEPLQDVLVRDVRRPLFLLWGAAFAVLVIGVANLCTIAMARSRARVNELGTRLALGARRLDIIRQLLVEALLVSAAGTAIALALASSILSAVRVTQPELAEVHIDGAAAAITCGFGLIATVLMGIVSALPLFSMQVGTMLTDSMRGATRTVAVRATWRTLVAAQMACSFMLLMGSALLWISVRNLLAVDPGFRTENVITAITNLSGPRYAADDAVRSFVSRSLASIRQLPGVLAAGATTIVPMTSSGQTGVVIAEGYVPKAGEPVVSGMRSLVTPGYFEAVGTPLVRGRYFDVRDESPGTKSIVIDERLARRFWPDGDAIGRRMFCPMNATQLAKIDANTDWLTVIGVVRTARLHGPTSDEAPSGTSGTYYVPYASAAPRDVGFVIRTGQASTAIVHDVRTALARIDQEVPLFDIRTLSERAELALSPRTNTMHLAMLFAAVGVFLSALGVYGMLAYLVAQRRREIGIRMAVGSAPGAIVALVLREGLWLTVVGIVVGAAASAAFGRVLASQLYGVTPSNPWVMLVISAVLCAIATAACISPARRAARIDVMRTLSGS